MTTDPIDLIRAYIQVNENTTHISKVDMLTALETVRSNYLPLELLPEGWRVFELKQRAAGQWQCEVTQWYGEGHRGRKGTTPNAAFLAAVEAIGDV